MIIGLLAAAIAGVLSVENKRVQVKAQIKNRLAIRVLFHCFIGVLSRLMHLSAEIEGTLVL
jgi:hypothetical protein